MIIIKNVLSCQNYQMLKYSGHTRQKHALNEKITDVEYFDARVLKTSKQMITTSLKGKEFSGYGASGGNTCL